MSEYPDVQAMTYMGTVGFYGFVECFTGFWGD